MADTSISDDRARTFAAGLQTFEKDGDTAAFAALFADDAVTNHEAEHVLRLGAVRRDPGEGRLTRAGAG